MQLIKYIVFSLWLFSFCQVYGQTEVYILIDLHDPLIKREIIKETTTYLLYDEKLIQEKDSLEQANAGILPAGFCEYYYFDTNDTGEVVDSLFMKGQLFLTRNDLSDFDFKDAAFFAVERLSNNAYLIKRLHFSACD
ncbi:MAG: hypothetical protein U5K79_17315 [Cyclobacteriaceae bacterium]|nr:hypothetical protein [Cyclobacteriaceae bacterium]